MRSYHVSNREFPTPDARRLRGVVAWWVVGGVCLTLAGAAVGYKLLFDRPGEMAINYLPLDSQVVLTVDLKPSLDQVATFDSIKQALKEEGLLDQLEEGIAQFASQNKVVAAIRPHVETSVAVAVWGLRKGRDPENAILLISVDNGPAAAKILDANLRAYMLNGERAYVIDKNVTAAVLDNYLVVTSNEASMRKVIAVKNGDAKSVASLAEYAEARSALPADANAMLFVSSLLLREGGKEIARGLNGANPFAGAGWFAVGLTVRETGLLCTCRSPFDSATVTEIAPLAQVSALTLRTLELMPLGAFGAASLSEPAALYDVVKAFAMKKPESKRDMEEGLARIRRESGFDLERDVLPAFRGEFTAALYPGEVPGHPDPELLFVLNNGNGATPALFAEKFRLAVASGRFDKEKPAPKVQTETYKGATIHWIDLTSEPAAKKPGYVVLDGNVVAATHINLLHKALEAAGAGAGLSTDRRFARIAGRRVDGAKFALLVDLPAILEEASRKGEAPDLDWRNVFGNDGLALSAGYDGRNATAELFFPLDWATAIHRIGEQARNGPGSVSPGPFTPDESAF